MHLLLLVTTLLVLKDCYSEMCAEKTCVEKCCPANYYVKGQGMCEDNPGLDVTTMPFTALNKTEDLGNLDVKPAGNLNFNYLVKYWRVKIEDFPYNVIENGTLMMLKKSGEYAAYIPSEYCVDYYVVEEANTSAPDVTVWIKLSQIIIKDNTFNENMKFGLPISCVFLLLVLIVYCLLPELRTLGGLVLMAHVTSLMISYVMLFSFQMMKNFPASKCIPMTLITYFFFMSAFCWMNVMSYDIWWTFRGYAKARKINRRGEIFKFKMYCLYAFGLPLAMTVAMWIVIAYSEKLEGIIRPQIPQKECFLQDEAKLLYLYVPMLILLLCNWTFFIMTAFNIWRSSRASKLLSSEDSAATSIATVRNGHKQRFIMYLKLSTLMGLNWILEVLRSLVSDLDIWFWYVTDAYNILIGVVIFLIFVCKRKIFIMLKKRFKQQKLGPHQMSTSFRSRSRSTLDSNTPQDTPLKPREMQIFSF